MMRRVATALAFKANIDDPAALARASAMMSVRSNAWLSARPRLGAAGPAPHGASGRGLGTHSMAPRAMSRGTILSATSSLGLPRPRAVDTYRPWPDLVLGHPRL